MNPRGGTELQVELLERFADKNLLNKVQITTSVPEKIPLHPTKPNILWLRSSISSQNKLSPQKQIESWGSFEGSNHNRPALRCS